MVGPAGIEPACSIEREILSLLCLPIPPRSLLITILIYHLRALVSTTFSMFFVREMSSHFAYLFFDKEPVDPIRTKNNIDNICEPFIIEVDVINFNNDTVDRLVFIVFLKILVVVLV